MRLRALGSLPALRLALACALGIAAALLVSCGSSGKGLIPTANAGPLQSDFEEVAQAAQTGGGNCTATEAAIAKTEQDFNLLPASVDVGLRTRLQEGITNLSKRARVLCAQPLSSTTTTGTTARTTTTTATTVTTPTTTQTTTTSITPTTSTPTTGTTTSGVGGGTAAPTTEAPAGSGGGGAAGEGSPAGGVGAGGGVGREAAK